MNIIKIIIGIILLIGSAGALLKRLPKEKSNSGIIGFIIGVAVLITVAIYLIRSAI